MTILGPLSNHEGEAEIVPGLNDKHPLIRMALEAPGDRPFKFPVGTLPP